MYQTFFLTRLRVEFLLKTDSGYSHTKNMCTTHSRIFLCIVHTSRRGTHGVFASACWEVDRCDREKSIWSVTTGPDLIGLRHGLILTRVRAPPEEQD